MVWWETFTGGLLFALVLLLILAGTVMLTATASIRWTNRMRDLQTATLTSRLRDLESQQIDLLNRVMSKDAMTYSTLAAQTTSSGYPNADHLGLTPVGTDEDEYARYKAQYPGQELDPDDDADIREFLVS